jgi:hypothetical protein
MSEEQFDFKFVEELRRKREALLDRARDRQEKTRQDLSIFENKIRRENELLTAKRPEIDARNHALKQEVHAHWNNFKQLLSQVHVPDQTLAR